MIVFDLYVGVELLTLLHAQLLIKKLAKWKNIINFRVKS